MPSVIALRDALLALLKADAGVAALVGARVFDRVPDAKDKPTYPLVGCGPMRIERHETGDDPARPTKLRFFAASRDFDRDEAWEVAQAAIDAIEGATPELASPWHLAGPLRVTMAGDALETGQPRNVFLDVSAILYRA